MAANPSIAPSTQFGAAVSPTISSKQVTEQVVALGDVAGNLLKTTDNGDGTSTLVTSSSGSSSTANQGTPAAVANAWPVEITDGTNTVALSTAQSATAVPVLANVPASANILAGTSSSAGGTVITIPATRIWTGQILISGSVTVAGGASSGVSATPNVAVTGSTAIPAAATVLAQLSISVAANLTGSLNGSNANDAATINAVVYAGTSAATLQLNFGSATAASASAVGYLR